MLALSMAQETKEQQQIISSESADPAVEEVEGRGFLPILGHGLYRRYYNYYNPINPYYGGYYGAYNSYGTGFGAYPHYFI